jgi:hypothetical protein
MEVEELLNRNGRLAVRVEDQMTREPALRVEV